MPDAPNRTLWVIQGTAIALLTWGVLTFAKDYLGRTASLVLAGLVFLAFVVVLWARARSRSGGGQPPE